MFTSKIFFFSHCIFYVLRFVVHFIPYFTGYKTHYFLRKIASKIQVRLILEINIKMSSVWFKIPPVLKMAIYSMPWETYLYLATLDSTGGSIAQMRWIWVAGIHKLANTVSLPPRHPKPRTLSSLCCVIAVYGASELELKVICVIGRDPEISWMRFCTNFLPEAEKPKFCVL